MKWKLKTKMILAIIGFLFVMFGSSVVLYSLFADEYYGYVTKDVVEGVFRQISQMQIEKPVSDDVAGQLEKLSEDGVNILICDENNKIVFSSQNNKTRPLIRRYVKKRKAWYSTEPKAVVRKKRVDLYGVLKGDSLYYVYLWQNMSGIQNTVVQTRNLFWVFTAVTMICGALAVGAWGGRIVTLIREIGGKTRRIAEGDFSSQSMKSRIPSDELGDLVRDIEAMSDIIEGDIRALKNYNYLLQERTERLEKYQAVHQDYITKTTHDLKTPLAIIGSQVEMMELSDDPQKRQYYLESIQDEIDKMSERISEVLKNSVIERSLRDMVLRKVDLHAYMEGLSRKYEAWMETENIEYSYEGETQCFAMIEEETLEHAINNYVMNACSHTRIGGKIRIELSCGEEYCEISVMNEGKSIEEADINDIWEKYYQKMEPEDGRQAAYGVGLGLQIVKEIVVMHDGEYGVKNVEGGVCFYIRLPRVKE